MRAARRGPGERVFGGRESRRGDGVRKLIRRGVGRGFRVDDKGDVVGQGGGYWGRKPSLGFRRGFVVGGFLEGVWVGTCAFWGRRNLNARARGVAAAVGSAHLCKNSSGTEPCQFQQGGGCKDYKLWHRWRHGPHAKRTKS